MSLYTSKELTILTMVFLTILYLIYRIIRCELAEMFPGVGSGSSSKIYNTIKLKRGVNDDVIGKGFHRSGWPSVVERLSIFHSDSGILLDDFVEQTFCYEENPEPYKEPWIGIFHHPEHIPYFGNPTEKIQNLLKLPAFQESLKHLKLAVVLSSDLKAFWEKHLECPVVFLHHPVAFGFKEWDLEAYRNNKDKKLIQLGFYQRNTQLYNQVPVDNAYRIWINQTWVQTYDIRVKKHWELIDRSRIPFNMGKELRFLPASKFDKELTKNVVMAEYFAVAASNAILDCISRNTPILVNRTPATEDYLGRDYPLFFDDPKEIRDLSEPIKIIQGYNYLKNMNKEHLTLDYFTDNLLKTIQEL